MQFVTIKNQSRNSKPIRVQKCDSFLCRLRGLMFCRSLGTHDGLLMVQPTSSRVDAAIHMMFMWFDLAVVWLDTDLRVVDVQYCKRWRPAYVPSSMAKYVLELNVQRQDDFHPGDQILVEPC